MELISLILNLLLSGGIIVTIVTLKSTRRKASAEAKGVEIENDEKASKVMMEYVVEPLKREISSLRRDVRKLQRAIDKISECPYKESCPVRIDMEKNGDN